MAKQGKVLPARRPRGEESLLIRSAETLGRAIGRLQRQLERTGTSAHDTAGDGDGNGAPKARRASGAKKSATTRSARPAAKKK